MCRRIGLPTKMGVRKGPGVDAAHRGTMVPIIEGVCIGSWQRTPGKMRFLNEYCWNWKQRYWGVLQETARIVELWDQKIYEKW